MTIARALAALLVALALALWTTLADTVLPPEVVFHLTAEPDFRHVTLRWEHGRQVSPQLYGFEVRYCELLAWGPTRCHTKTVDAASGHELVSENRKSRAYSAVVGDLRMATNYSFEVRPVDRKGWDHSGATKALSKSILVTTKGFSAKATQCLPRASEVEVLTGPHFAGRIAVEAARGGGERCAVDGDPSSSRDTYLLRIDHEACGAHVNETAVAAFVVVQESLPILTHSTRRFLVLCTFKPETLTVRAGINLPGARRRQEMEGNNQVESVDPVILPFDTEMESVNDVLVARLQRNQQVVEARSIYSSQDHSAAQVVLMTFLVIAVVMGCIAAAWWFIPGIQSHLQARHLSAFDTSSSASSTYQNFENSLRDSPDSELVLDASVLGSTAAESDDFESISSSNLGPAAGFPECANANVTSDARTGVLAICIPPAAAAAGSSPFGREDRPCITLEHASQSEA